MKRLVAVLPLLLASAHVASAELPPSCATQEPLADDTTPIAELRRRIEETGESDPFGAFRVMCATIPRVAREHGEDSLELAWWVQSLATPLIAYMDKFAEAVPLLELARPILERHLGPDAPELAEIQVAFAWMAFRQGRLADAGTAWERALRIRERVPGKKKVELQKALVGLAQVRLAQRDFTAAQRHLERAYAIVVENGETVSEAAAAIENAFTNLEQRREDYRAARRHAEAQLRIELQLQTGIAQLVSANVTLGQILERLDEFEESEKVLREAIRIAESKEGPFQRHYLRALVQLGILLNERGKPQEALDFAERALAVGESALGDSAPTLVRVLVSLAEVHRALGELPQALHFYERAGRIIEEHRNDVERQVVVGFYRGFGNLQWMLGDSASATTLLAQGLEAAGDDAALSTERAGVLLALSRSHEELQQSLELFRARLPDAHPVILRVINELCGHELADQPANAPSCTEAAGRLETAREVEPALRHAVYENQSRLAEQRDDARAAYDLAVRALSAAATLGTPDPQWRAQYRLGRLLHAREQPTLAIFFGKQSITQIERLRAGFAGEERRLERGFLQDKVEVYRAVADWLMQAARIDEGLQVLGLLKAEELYDFILRNAHADGEQSRLDLTPEEQRLRARYTSLVSADPSAGEEIDRLTRLLETRRISAQERRRLEELLVGQRSAEAARTARLREFTARDSTPESAALGTARTVQAERLEREVQRFGPDTAIAVYLLTGTHLRVLVATRAQQTEHRIALDAATLRRDIGRFLDLIARREDVRAASRSLYETLARPVDEAAHRAGAKRLVLWPDGALRYVPFAALHDGARYLVEKYALQIYSEAAENGSPQLAVPRSLLTVRGLGVTRAVAGYQALPAVADELCYIVRGPIEGLESSSKACRASGGALRGAGFADAAFTEARLNALLGPPRDFSVLHLGTHFSLRPGNALRSFLVLGDGSRMTLDTINTLDFTGIELMTLSACQTALGGAVTDDGREVEGLSTIVQRRGARRVVASLWPVEDLSTAALMRHMYGSLSSSAADVARALQRAQLSLGADGGKARSAHAHPYYWAGFLVSSGQP
ncbi:MAG: CHAT domain-containing protein [Gammaproteobacteria bacterium]